MSDWVWLAILLVTNGMMLLSAHLRYKHGIWDGAFNHFIPHVQKAMREYDDRRTDMILAAREQGYGVWK
ncbi:hypothetical protein [Methylorubrum populi]|uniref:Uncharacterized protein n=1 Tax=Methylorubrum populi TaxID=223967 RepID=A0A833MZV4_9HYPH|nr:hypothetical protein [Methylorubrum populi]KAB7788022.1 hypothetical protein F8B43_0027 [Methylorubrum populi]